LAQNKVMQHNRDPILLWLQVLDAMNHSKVMYERAQFYEINDAMASVLCCLLYINHLEIPLRDDSLQR